MYKKDQTDGWKLDEPKLLLSVFYSRPMSEFTMPNNIYIDGLIKASIEGKLIILIFRILQIFYILRWLFNNKWLQF